MSDLATGTGAMSDGNGSAEQKSAHVLRPTVSPTHVISVQKSDLARYTKVLVPARRAEGTPLSPKGNADDGSAEHGPDDVSGGPLQRSGCTDVWCFFVFLAMWAGFGIVTLAGMKDGNPAKLYSPRDYKGDYCGAEKNWNGGPNLETYKKLIHMMNLTMMVDSTAKQFVCSTAAEAELRVLVSQGVMTVVEMEKYMCACCKTPCDSCVAVLGLDDFTSPADAAQGASDKMGGLTGANGVSALFSPTGPNGGEFNNMFSEATKYFYQVCVTDCNLGTYNGTDKRAYTYSPAPDADWRDAWEKLRTSAGVSPAMQATMSSSFTFSALPGASCPYQAKYCVPQPGTSFEELYGGYCSFKVSQTALSAMGTSGDALQVEEASAQGFETLGTAMGDVIDSLDTFAVVSVLAFVHGFVFLILLRFCVGCFVWSAVFGVFVLFLGSGAAAYVRAGQCAGTSMVDTSNNYADSAATVASNKANGITVDTNREALTGTGADYLGFQKKTRGARKCQAWNAQTPHVQGTTALYLAAVPSKNLTENYCRNPNGAQYIWCYTTDPEVRWELCDPVGVYPWSHECPTGYTVKDEGSRKMLEIFAYILWIFSALWFLVVCCLHKRIQLALALNKVAATFLYHTPRVIFVPVVQAIFAIFWTLTWCLCASFILSQVPAGYVPTESFTSYAEAYGTTDVPGKCNAKWPQGYAWKYEGDVTVKGDSCSGDMGITSAAGFIPACWRCCPPRFMLDPRFFYSFFSYLWVNNFLVALGQCTIAGACGVWFFADHGTKAKQKSVQVGLKNAVKHHMGSLALGSFIIAAVQFVRYVVLYLQKQSEATKNYVMVLVFKIVGCLIRCLEKCIEFITKNAFIQIALTGKNFCASAKKAFWIIFRNGARFGVFAVLGGIINFLGVALIMCSTLFMGYYMLMLMHEDISPVMPMILFGMMAYVVAKLFMMVFHLACDSMIMCFMITEEMGLETSREFVPPGLRSLIKSTE